MEPTSPRLTGMLLVLSAPSGAGKTTLAHRLIREVPRAEFSISYTTRAPRGAEQNGIDYHFVDAATFQQKLERGEFLEYAEVHGHFYASSKATVDRARAIDGVVVYDIDVQGGTAIKKKFPDAVLVFVIPPSMEELERRLRDRKTDSEDTIRKRLLAARAEVERGVQSYDFLVVNDDLDHAFSDLKAVVTAERCRRERADLARLKL